MKYLPNPFRVSWTAKCEMLKFHVAYIRNSHFEFDVVCSVFEEHHRAGIERERECINQREGQKYDNHMLELELTWD